MRSTVWKVTIGLAACGGLVLPISSAAAATAAVPQVAVASAAVARSSGQSSPALARLQFGDSGSQVAAWQARVNGLVRVGLIEGPVLVEDGDFGARTRAATRTVQAGLNLARDGVVGPLTRAAVAEQEAAAGLGVGSGLSADQVGERVLAPGMRGADVRSWQAIVNTAVRLGRLDHPRVAEDGAFGPQTRRATVVLQGAAHVEADGYVGPTTRTAVGWLLEGLPD